MRRFFRERFLKKLCHLFCEFFKLSLIDFFNSLQRFLKKVRGNDKKGMTLMEILLSLLLITSVSLVLLDTSQLLRIEEASGKYEKSFDMSYYQTRVRDDLESYQPFLDHSEAQKYLSDTQTEMKQAWDSFPWAVTKKGGLKSKDSCVACKRRIGLIVVPVDESKMKGLFEVVFRGLEKKETNPGSFTYTEFHRETSFLTTY